MHGVLIVEGNCLALKHASFDAIPVSPPDLGWQPVRMELHTHVKVVNLTHHRTAELTFAWIRVVAGVSVGDPVLERDRFAKIKSPGEQYLGEEDVIADIADIPGKLLASLTDLQGEDVRVAKERDPVDALHNRFYHA